MGMNVRGLGSGICRKGVKLWKKGGECLSKGPLHQRNDESGNRPKECWDILPIRQNEGFEYLWGCELEWVEMRNCKNGGLDGKEGMATNEYRRLGHKRPKKCEKDDDK